MNKEKEEKPPINPEYTSAESHYKREVLVTTAQPFLKRAFFAVWGVVDAILILAFLVSVGFYLVYGSFAENRQIAKIGNNIQVQKNIGVSRQAVDVDIDTSRLFALGEGRYDFYTEVTNPNTDWYAEFEYYFESNNGSTDVQKGFLLPGDTRPITSLNQEFTTRPSSPDLVIQDMVWRRVDHHVIADVEPWLNDHQNFEITDASYGFDVEVDGQNIARSTFTINNMSQFSYWNAIFTVALTRGGTVVGVNQVLLQGLESGESRIVDVNWFDGAPSSGEVEVTAQINYFDESVYLDLSNEAIEDVRDRLQ